MLRMFAGHGLSDLSRECRRCVIVQVLLRCGIGRRVAAQLARPNCPLDTQVPSVLTLVELPPLVPGQRLLTPSLDNVRTIVNLWPRDRKGASVTPEKIGAQHDVFATLECIERTVRNLVNATDRWPPRA